MYVFGNLPVNLWLLRPKPSSVPLKSVVPANLSWGWRYLLLKESPPRWPWGRQCARGRFRGGPSDIGGIRRATANASSRGPNRCLVVSAAFRIADAPIDPLKSRAYFETDRPAKPLGITSGTAPGMTPGPWLARSSSCVTGSAPRTVESTSSVFGGRCVAGPGAVFEAADGAVIFEEARFDSASDHPDTAGCFKRTPSKTSCPCDILLNTRHHLSG